MTEYNNVVKIAVNVFFLISTFGKSQCGRIGPSGGLVLAHDRLTPLSSTLHQCSAELYLHEVGVLAQDGPCDLLVVLQQVL